MKIRFLFFILLAHQASGQQFKEKELSSKIEQVTVFMQGANITREAEGILPKGTSVLVLKALSPHIDEKSIQVKANGEFTVLGVNHKFNYLQEIAKNQQIDSLLNLSEQIESQIKISESRLQVLMEKQSLLNTNKNLGGENSGPSLDQLKQVIDYYDQLLTEIKSEELSLDASIKIQREERAKIELQVGTFQKEKQEPTSEIMIRVEADKATTGKLEVSYLVANAGWFPKYDVRVADVNSPIQLFYKADVYQNTGVNWDNVKLRFSNGNPNQSGLAPELQPWYLNYAHNTIYQRNNYGSALPRAVSGVVTSADDGETVPGVNVVIKGTTLGTVTDINGRYSLTVPNNASQLVFSFIGLESEERAINSNSINPALKSDVTQLSEVVLAGYASGGMSPLFAKRKDYENLLTTSVIENQTTVEFEVDKPYTVKSNGTKLSVDLIQHEIEVDYNYYAAPKLDKDAFLIARIVNWDQYNLLEGEANLYFENTFVGRSILDAKALKDTLDISLGRDKNIVIGRTKITDYSKNKIAGLNKIESLGFEVIVRNKKSTPIKITLFDQIPVSVLNEIQVELTEFTGAEFNEKTGELKWELTLASKEQKKLEFGYTVKYPKRQKVILE